MQARELLARADALLARADALQKQAYDLLRQAADLRSPPPTHCLTCDASMCPAPCPRCPDPDKFWKWREDHGYNDPQSTKDAYATARQGEGE